LCYFSNETEGKVKRKKNRKVNGQKPAKAETKKPYWSQTLNGERSSFILIPEKQVIIKIIFYKRNNKINLRKNLK
jgi:hypothetical protein